MGLGIIDAVIGSVGGVLADQYKEFFVCPEMTADELVVKGQNSKGKRNYNNGSDNIISNGSAIVVNEGQAMIIVDQGAIVEYCVKPGTFVWNSSSEPSIFTDGLKEGLLKSFETFKRRVTFGGGTGSDQRIYYFNTKKIIGNKYGTPTPIIFHLSDPYTGLELDASLRCNGEYSYKLVNPIVFYKNICGAVEEAYTRDQIDSQLKSELLSALQPAFGRLAETGVSRYASIPAKVKDLTKFLKEELKESWGENYGIEIDVFAINSIRASEEDEKTIKRMQASIAMSNPALAAGRMAEATASAMESAASNTSAGPMMAFAGMNMASGNGGAMTQALFEQAAVARAQQQVQQQQAAQQVAQPAAQPAGWTCSCGHAGNTGKFCMECGKPKPAEQAFWTCSCGAQNKGKFCQECGQPKPAGTPQYKCDKCGWEPKDPTHPPKFCPECGDPFDDGDIVK